MNTLRKSLLQFIFSGSFMRRWNDKLRPVQLYEIDKQAHKMITAFLLYSRNCRNFSDADRIALGKEIIEGGLFDYLYRLVITDIKPPVYYRIKENREHFRELTEWVLKDLEPRIRTSNESLWERLKAYHMRCFADDLQETTADRILRAAHLYASQWEFNLIKPLNSFDEELHGIEASFAMQLASMADLPGVADLIGGSGNAFGKTANHCGQLRFQIRWSQISRIPETSVLGHMMAVAAYSYLISLDMGLSDERCVNNYFSGLFHDLPELLTRDIISPVKSSVAKLPGVIHQYEEQELQLRILWPLQEAGASDIADRLAYYLGVGLESEFLQTARDADGRTVIFNKFMTEDENAHSLKDRKDGELIKVADKLAAFIEAHTSAYNGISSPELQAAMARLKTEIGKADLGRFDAKALLADFD